MSNRFKWVDGFTPGLHCTDISHHVKSELALAAKDPRYPHVCLDCLPKTLQGMARSDAAKRGVETRRRNVGKRAPRLHHS